MSEIPEFLKKNLSSSILGRARLRLFEQISGRKNWMPSDGLIRKFLLQTSRSSPEIGKLFLFLLNGSMSKSKAFSKLKDPKDAANLLFKLEQRPLAEPFILEVTNCSKDLPKTLGICVYSEPLADSGYVYVVTFFDDDGFPESFWRIE